MMKTEVLRDYIVRANEKGLFNWMPDKPFLHLMYWARIGRRLNLKNPRTYNEKLQWLKLYNRQPEYVAMVDKYEAKKYVAERIGEEYIIPTLGVWDRFEDIDFDALPDQFALKCTHDSGGLVIVRDKATLDLEAAREKINRSLRNNYYLRGREWLYKNVKPRIIAEQYMCNSEAQSDAAELTDYKFMCFHGVVENILTITDRFSEKEMSVTFLDRTWNPLPFGRCYARSRADLPKPKNLEKMIELAECLSRDIPFVRVDFYEAEGRIYFGEITFFPGNGMEGFRPEQWDEKLGELIDLSRVKRT